MERQSWKMALTAILREHNARHGRKDKSVSHLTQHQRFERIFLAFHQLRELGYRLEDPRGLRAKHVKALVQHWVAIGYAPATIQTRLSHLRVFCRWMGKPNVVGTVTEYVADPKLVKRKVNATVDQSWSACGVDIERVITAVYDHDRFVANQLLGELLFGFRVKEAVLFRPHIDDLGHVIQAMNGTKGGRLRTVRVEYPEQREVLNLWKRECRRHHSLADPALSLKQAITRYYSVMRTFGINKKTKGVTSHGLRKEYANLRYADVAGAPSPIRGGAVDRETDRAARLTVMQELGHSREQVSGAYLGGVLRGMQKRITESWTPAPDAEGQSSAPEQSADPAPTNDVSPNENADDTSGESPESSGPQGEQT